MGLTCPSAPAPGHLGTGRQSEAGHKGKASPDSTPGPVARCPVGTGSQPQAHTRSLRRPTRSSTPCINPAGQASVTSETRPASYKCGGHLSPGNQRQRMLSPMVVSDLQDVLPKDLTPKFAISHLDICHSLVFVRDFWVGVLQGPFLFRGFLGLSVPSMLHNTVTSAVTSLRGFLGSLRPHGFSAFPPLSAPPPSSCYPAPLVGFSTPQTGHQPNTVAPTSLFLAAPPVLP